MCYLLSDRNTAYWYNYLCKQVFRKWSHWMMRRTLVLTLYIVLICSGRIPMRQLVYRVQALPQSLLPLVWDFGQLSTHVEELYIRQMVARYVRTKLICHCQVFVIHSNAMDHVTCIHATCNGSCNDINVGYTCWGINFKVYAFSNFVANLCDFRLPTKTSLGRVKARKQSVAYWQLPRSSWETRRWLDLCWTPQKYPEIYIFTI